MLKSCSFFPCQMLHFLYPLRKWFKESLGLCLSVEERSEDPLAKLTRQSYKEDSSLGILLVHTRASKQHFNI